MADNNLKLSQSFEFPTIILAKYRFQKEETALSEQSRYLTERELIRGIKKSYYQCVFGLRRLALLQEQDSIYQNFSKLGDLRYQTGETNHLGKLAAQSKANEITLQKQQAAVNLAVYYQELEGFLGIT